MNSKVRTQLSIMMFLQFFIWGAWCVTLGTYLGKGLNFSGEDIGKVYSIMPLGAIIAPFFVGMVADRFFSAEKVMGILHILGGIVMFYFSGVVSLSMMLWVMFVYALCYNPTLALVNAISFNQMENPEKQFPSIRVFGTLGWIAAGVIIGKFIKIDGASIEPTAIPLKIAAGASFLMGLYSFTLPNTPPKSLGHKVTVSDVLGLDALKLMKNSSFAIFVIGSLLICIPLAFYYNFTNLFLNDKGVPSAAGIQAWGQVSEVFFMIVMPFFFIRLGVKKMLLLGMVAWSARYLLFAFGNPGPLVWMYFGGIILHGVCYDFFFVTGQIYVEKTAPKSIQASAQGFIALVTYGVGLFIGSLIAGSIVEKYQIMEDMKVVGYNWQSIWIIPAIMAFVVICLFAIFFKDKVNKKEA